MNFLVRFTVAIIIATSFIAPFQTMAQDNTVLNYIQHKSDIKEGGTGLYKFRKDNYLITVTSLTVGAKNEQNCKTIGSGKAKRDMIAYINGSNITSYTEFVTSETVSETLEGKSIPIEQKYVESIKETVLGTISEVKSLGGWYSDDKSVYYFAVFKSIL